MAETGKNITHDGDARLGGNTRTDVPKKLWDHPAPEKTKMYQFMQKLNKDHRLDLKTYQDLHKWSVENISLFWGEVWRFTGVKAEQTYDKVQSSLD